ncbi:MAG TPA: hypothetical protein VHT75_08975 [Acidimicrobiales bacterium]|jgi:hypothetical protein|nr:hypothetical protein [Acidimicrobiales bacterium]
MTWTRLYPWMLRAGWVALPFAAGPAFGAALHPHSEAVRLAATVVLWAPWAVVLVGTLVPHPLGLTALRLFAPAALAAAAAAAGTGRPSGLAAVAAVVLAGADVVLAFTPATGALYANGPAYPNERRYPLRPPGPLLLGPLELSWAVTVGAPVAGVLLLAARAWVAGAIVVVMGSALAWVLGRSLHSLSRRWVVFVPAGVVLHDPLALLDPVLFPRTMIEALRPAPADSDSLDLTQGALGLAVELVLLQKIDMTRVKPGRLAGEQGASGRLLFTPTRPGQVLAEAGRRRVPVGS